MPRFANPTTQYFNNSGQILSGGKLRFKTSGSDSLKDTYSNVGLSSANANPVVLDSAGRAPDIFLSGTYRVELLDSSDVMIWQRDPVGDDSPDSPWGTWSNGTAYSIGDIVRASNNAYYRSLVNSNTSNDPVSSTVQWEQLNLIAEWNTNRTYSDQDIVSYAGKFYESTANSNSGSTPTGKSNWTLAVETPVMGQLTIPNQTNSFAVTGVGFKPSLVKVEVTAHAPSGDTWVAASTGFTSAPAGTSNSKCIFWRIDGTVHENAKMDSYAYFCTNDSVNQEVSGYISSMDSDGFTVEPVDFTNIVTGEMIWTAFP